MDMIQKYANTETETTRYSGLNKENKSRGSDNNTKQRRSKDMNIIKVKSMIGLLFVVLLVSVSVSLSATLFSGGSGTEQYPWHIENATDLDSVRDFPDSHYVQTADIDLFDFLWDDLNNDWINNGEGWEPISGFSGHYYGSGYYISNLFIARPNSDNVGLFGDADNAHIGGITLLNVSIVARDNVGAIIGFNDGGILTLSNANGIVLGENFVGGLVGENSGIIAESYSLDINVTGNLGIGGITGYNCLVSVIKNTYSSAQITGINIIGGLVGYNEGTIENSYSLSDIDYPFIETELFVGGLVGENTGTVINSYWNTDIFSLDNGIGDGRSTNDMTYPYNQNTYIDWDFYFRWVEDISIGHNGFPFLIRATGDIDYLPWPIFSGGDGSINNPYQVETAYQLNWIRHPHFISSHFVQMDDIDLSDWDEGEGWEPIGTPYIPFGGPVISQNGNDLYTCSYNGNGFLLSNLFINRPSSNFIGFFGYVRGANIINVTIDELAITGYHMVGSLAGAVRKSRMVNCISESTPAGISNSGNFVGGLVGLNLYSSIEDCHTSVEVRGTQTVGGLVGSNAYSTISVSSSSHIVRGSADQVGGLVGANVTPQSIINNSHSTSIVINTGMNTGGLVGWNNQATIEYSYSTGEVNGISYVGGLVGKNQNSATVYGSYSTNIVTGSNQSIGGLVGNNSWYSIIDNCYSTGATEGNSEVGGLVGGNYDSTIQNCHSTSNVIGDDMCIGGLVGLNLKSGKIKKSYSTGDVSGYGYNVGGLVGSNWGYINNDPIYHYAIPALIQESYSTSNVESTSNYVGGLVGANYVSYIENSYSTGNVTGSQYVGGLLGWNMGEAVGNTTYFAIVENSYSTGFVTGNNDEGGLVGYNSNESFVDYSYWDTETSGQLNSAAGEGKTTYEMLNYYTFDNWGFTMGFGIPPIWCNWSTDYWNPYILKTYPYFYWQGEPGEHNKPLDADEHVKYYRNAAIGELTHWESFPRLEIQSQWAYTSNLLAQILCEFSGIENVANYNTGVQHPYMYYNYGQPEGWVPTPGVTLNSVDGYFFDFKETVLQEHYLKASGEWSPRSKMITLDEYIQVHWIGYWYQQTQSLFDAISEYEQYIEYVQGQDGGIYRDAFDVWYGIDDVHAYYGKMYEILFRESPILPDDYSFEFDWAINRNEQDQEIDYVDYHFNRPKPKHFVYRDGPRYEEFFIEDIDNDEGLVEIGAFVGEECVGASVFEGKYPIRLMAFTEPSHSEREISFVLHRETRGEDTEHIREVEARNNRTGKYSKQVLRPLQQKYTLVRLGTGDYTETVVTPQVVMGQNYPNPFVMSVNSSQTRSGSVADTNIPIYLSEDMKIVISVFNIRGQKVKTVSSGKLAAGKHNIIWDGRNEQNQPVGAGIYLYRLESDIETINRKMLLIK